MRNNLQTLNDVLFEQIERINDDELVGDELNEQLRKSKEIKNLAQAIINNGRLMMDAQKIINKDEANEVPQILLSERKNRLRLEAK